MKEFERVLTLLSSESKLQFEEDLKRKFNVVIKDMNGDLRKLSDILGEIQDYSFRQEVDNEK